MKTKEVSNPPARIMFEEIPSGGFKAEVDRQSCALQQRLGQKLSNSGYQSETISRRSALLVRSGSAVVQIFGRDPGPYTIAWRESSGGARRRVTRAKFPAAKRFAQEKAIALANGETTLASFTAADRASHLRALELLAPTGKSLEIAAAEYASCAQKLASASLLEAVDFYLQHRRSYRAGNMLCSMLVEDLLAELRADDEVSQRWLGSLGQQLGRFTARFKCPLTAVQGADLNAWLLSLEVGPVSRNNYRGAVLQLVNYAKRTGALPKDWDEMDLVPRRKKKAIEIKILTPEQMVTLLASARDNLVPFIAIAGFAGLRHSEIAGLDWRDVRLKEKLIYVPVKVAKTGEDRIVPIADNLLEWLAGYARPNGPVCGIANSSCALCKTKHQAGIPAGKNETRNTLRKSFISYRLAMVKSKAQVAEEAGNSVRMIQKNYNRPIPESEARRWFEIWPTSANILQLQFALP